MKSTAKATFSILNNAHGNNQDGNKHFWDICEQSLVTFFYR
jgi:hypothetical protein